MTSSTARYSQSYSFENPFEPSTLVTSGLRDTPQLLQDLDAANYQKYDPIMSQFVVMASDEVIKVPSASATTDSTKKPDFDSALLEPPLVDASGPRPASLARKPSLGWRSKKAETRMSRKLQRRT